MPRPNTPRVAIRRVTRAAAERVGEVVEDPGDEKVTHAPVADDDRDREGRGALASGRPCPLAQHAAHDVLLGPLLLGAHQALADVLRGSWRPGPRPRRQRWRRPSRPAAGASPHTPSERPAGRPRTRAAPARSGWRWTARPCSRVSARGAAARYRGGGGRGWRPESSSRDSIINISFVLMATSLRRRATADSSGMILSLDPQRRWLQSSRSGAECYNPYLRSRSADAAVASARGGLARAMATTALPPKKREVLDQAVIRFAGDSGDGMQITGSQFTNTVALYGNDLATFPDFPAEIRAPAGTLPGVSGFQLHFSSRDIYTPGDAVDALVAMNPAALKMNMADLKPNGILIVNTDNFREQDLKKAQHDLEPARGPHPRRLPALPRRAGQAHAPRPQGPGPRRQEHGPLQELLRAGHVLLALQPPHGHHLQVARRRSSAQASRSWPRPTGWP